MKKPYIIGITGGSASGKTTFLNRLCSQFPPHELCLVSQDNYYKVRDQQPTDGNGIENYDTPQSIDSEVFVKDIKDLMMGKQIRRKEYTFNNPKSTAAEIVLNPAPVIVIEGVFIFWVKEIVDLIDLKLFIDAKEHIKLKRRIHRDLVERNYGLEDVLYRYEHHVSTAYDTYILPHKDTADLVIPNNHGFEAAFEVLTYFIKGKCQ
ncbi:MAG: uridine kinase [Cytophagales bacterium]|nr:uridine kinase [Cytophagales bacterium]